MLRNCAKKLIDLRSSRPFSRRRGRGFFGFSLVGVIASATKLLREEGGRRPETHSRWRRIYDLWPIFYTIQFYLGIECIVFVGVLLVSMYSVFWSLIPQD